MIKEVKAFFKNKRALYLVITSNTYNAVFTKLTIRYMSDLSIGKAQ